MRAHLVIDDTDYTDYIVANSYDVNAFAQYESWKDANFTEHRIIVAEKVKGKFKIFCDPTRFTVGAFLSAWNAAASNGVITLELLVINKNALETVNCHYEIKSAQHIKSIGGKLYDVLEVEISER